MKNKQIVPSSVEKKMRPDDFIVSKADTKGRLTYGNPIFFEFSGWTEREAIGLQHNFIRHPDMPRTIFHLLWTSIQQGGEVHAYIKNLSKCGAFYWVFANVTPDFDVRNEIVGYFSVRRAPKPSAVAMIETLYRDMLAAERKAGPAWAIAAGTEILTDTLKSTSYEEFVLSL